MEIAIVLSLLVIIIILFATDWLPFDVIGLIVLSVVLVSGIVKPADAFAGFGSDTIVTIGGLFAMTAALLRTGLMERIGRFLQKRAGTNTRLLTIYIMVTVSVVSAFISNTAATAFFLPAVIALSGRAKISPGKLLMPLAFAAILSSSVTLISTSTNIVVNGLMTKQNMHPMGMFELAPVGIPIVIAGLLYMFTIGMRLLPKSADKSLEDEYKLRDYLTEVIVLPESPLIGTTLLDARLGSEMDFQIIGIIRDGRVMNAPGRKEILQAGDVLLVEGRADEILSIKDKKGLEIHADYKLPEDAFQSKDIKLVEAMVMPGSDLRATTLKEAHFRERFGLTVLAINRHGITLRSKLNRIPLRMGDVMLIQGTQERLERVMADGHLTVLSELSDTVPRSPKAKYAVTIFILTILVGTFKILPFAPAILIGTLCMFLVGAITPEEAYKSVEWKILVLIGSMIAFGTAMEQSGAAVFLSHKMVDIVGNYGPHAILAGFFILTVLLTQPMSNQAAALVLVPIAIETANRMQMNPRCLVMTIAIAASCSYLTPLEPSCVLVYGPGRYKFMDFLKVGSLLTVIIFVISMFLIPLVWPLKP